VSLKPGLQRETLAKNNKQTNKTKKQKQQQQKPLLISVALSPFFYPTIMRA
jgi:hypothetical protein